MGREPGAHGRRRAGTSWAIIRACGLPAACRGLGQVDALGEEAGLLAHIATLAGATAPKKLTWLYIVGCPPDSGAAYPSLHLGHATHVIAQSRMRREKDGKRLRKACRAGALKSPKPSASTPRPSWPAGS